jgi:hypothetical protein
VATLLSVWAQAASPNRLILLRYVKRDTGETGQNGHLEAQQLLAVGHVALLLAHQIVELLPSQPHRDLRIGWGPVDGPPTDSEFSELVAIAPDLEDYVSAQHHFGCRNAHLHIVLRQLRLLARQTRRPPLLGQMIRLRWTRVVDRRQGRAKIRDEWEGYAGLTVLGTSADQARGLKWRRWSAVVRHDRS